MLKVEPDLYQYMQDNSLREHQVLKDLRDATAALDSSAMQISPEQGQFLALLVELLGVHKALEIGVYTGYSALSVALVLPADGQLVACDVSEEWTRIARQYWVKAGVDGKIDLRLRNALETLDDLIKSGEGGSFDFAFIDADKVNYDGYYERALTLLRPGGLIAIDNVLWDGKVIDPDVGDEDTLAIRALNKKIHQDQRVSISLLPIRDGLTLARKR